jgi:hypothetical protein
MRVYHLLSAKWARDDLMRRRLKVARFADLNDPFELVASNLSDKPLRRRFTRWKRPTLAAYGVLCFSRSWRSPVLWSHYADKHSGVCLGFDVPTEILKDISYVATRLPLSEADLRSGGPTDALRERLFCTKFQHWEYEKEVRWILRLQDVVKDGCHYFQPFDARLRLKEVIAGARCPLSQRQLLDSLGADAADVAVTLARPAFTSFSVVEDRRGFRVRGPRRTTACS